MAIPILFMPTSLIGSIAVVIAPELSENYYKNRKISLKNDIEKSIKAGLFIAASIIPFLFVLGEELGVLLYSDELSGKIIKACCFILFPMCVAIITTTVLNSMNCEIKTLIYFIFGAIATLACIIFLTPVVGIWSYLIGMALSFIITMACNLRLLFKKCREIKIFNYFFKCLIACVICCIFGDSLKNLFVHKLPLIATCIICCLGISLFIFALFYVLEVISIKSIKKIFLKEKK